VPSPGSEDKGLKDFVYNAIKYFAEQNQKAYQSSNLIDLMNKVVEMRRGEIFEDNISVSSMTGGLSGRGVEEKSFMRENTHTLTNISSTKFKPKASVGPK